jgi:hypothetical protein
MINGRHTRNSEDGTHRRERYDKEDGYRNHPPSWKPGGGGVMIRKIKAGLKKKRDKDEVRIETDSFTVCAAGVSCATI